MFNSIWDDIKAEIKSGKPVSIIIFINVVVFLAITLVKIVDAFFVPGEPGQLYTPVMEQILLREDIMVLLTHPWTIITHMFAHETLPHILFNMLVFFWFSKIVKDLAGEKHIWPLYLYGGLFGASFMIFMYNVVPGLDGFKALGASCAVNAIVLAAATLSPDYILRFPIFGDVKLKWIALAVVLISFAQVAEVPATGLGHLGGAIMGFFYVRQLRVGFDMTRPFYAVVYFFRRITGKVVPRKKPEVVYKKRNRTTTNTQKRENQDKIDVILDKISESGYDSLTAEEKALLFQRSKEE